MVSSSLAELFQEFIEFFAPSLSEQIDFTKKADFLQQELYQQIIQKKGKNYADLIVKVFLKNGEEKFILVHIEVQAIGGEAFAERMFRYFYRIYDKFNVEVYAIALLTDATYQSHNEKFNYSFHGTELTYRYNTYKFHGKDPEKLKQSSNPFALAVTAGIYASKSKNNEEKRYKFKEELIKLILQKYSHRDEKFLTALIYFVDYLLQVPEEWNEKLKVELEPMIKEGEAYMKGFKRLKDTPTFGLIYKEAEEKGREEVAKRLINKNFSDTEVSDLTGLDMEKIVKLRKMMNN